MALQVRQRCSPIVNDTNITSMAQPKTEQGPELVWLGLKTDRASPTERLNMSEANRSVTLNFKLSDEGALIYRKAIQQNGPGRYPAIRTGDDRAE
jgi:hypothetical protein